MRVSLRSCSAFSMGAPFVRLMAERRPGRRWLSTTSSALAQALRGPVLPEHLRAHTGLRVGRHAGFEVRLTTSVYAAGETEHAADLVAGDPAREPDLAHEVGAHAGNEVGHDERGIGARGRHAARRVHAEGHVLRALIA